MCQMAWLRQGRNAHGLRRGVHASVDVVADVVVPAPHTIVRVARNFLYSLYMCIRVCIYYVHMTFGSVCVCEL